jgi:hypothetical protein
MLVVTVNYRKWVIKNAKLKFGELTLTVEQSI